MLARKQKISSEEFKEYYKKGKKIFSQHFRITLVLGNTPENSKYAAVINKKTAKTAVLRNKNKRKIYKILRQIYPQFPQVKYGFIFIQKNIINIDEEILGKEITENMKKIIKKHQV